MYVEHIFRQLSGSRTWMLIHHNTIQYIMDGLLPMTHKCWFLFLYNQVSYQPLLTCLRSLNVAVLRALQPDAVAHQRISLAQFSGNVTVLTVAKIQIM